MAIQFNCPGCGALIRVPDAAAGKQGTCPRCSDKLLVPNLATAAGAATAVPQSAATSPSQPELPHLDFQAGRQAAVSARSTAQMQPVAGAPDTGRLPTLENSTAETTPEFGLPPLSVGGRSNIALEIQRKVRTQNKQVQGAWIVPVVCALGLIGFLAWYLVSAQPKLEGELTGHAVRDLEVKPGIIPGSASGLSADDRNEVLRHLRAEAAHWTSTASKLTLTGVKEGVEVTIQPGTAAHFVAVQPLANSNFLAYVTKHTAELDKPRLATINQNAPKLFAAWQLQFAKHETLVNQKDYRDLVALPTLVTGVGYHLEAVANGNIYPCVYEDSDGQVYFLLPNATKSFRLQGRRVAGGSYLPANFQVKINGTTAATKKKKLKSKADREAENQGMNPELYKQDMEEPSPEEDAGPDPDGQPQGQALKAGLGDMLTGDKPGQPVFKSKSMSKKSALMMDGDEDLMNDEMPAKSKPKQGSPKKRSSPDEMPQRSDKTTAIPPPSKRQVPQK